jgi:hypothetical protein
MKSSIRSRINRLCTSLTALIFVLTALISPSAVAQTAPTPPAPPAQPNSIREGRVISINAGAGYSTGLAKFAALGYYFNPDWIVEAYYDESSTVFFGHSISRAVRSKNFWNPIVYTNLGLIHRQTYGSNQFLDLMTSTFTGKETHYELRYWDIGPEFTVGSQWNYGGFHVGCDWIGVYWPLHVSKADIKLTEDGVVSRKTRDNLKTEPSARLLRVYVGISI